MKTNNPRGKDSSQPCPPTQPLTPSSPVTGRTASMCPRGKKAARCFCLEKPFYSFRETKFLYVSLPFSFPPLKPWISFKKWCVCRVSCGLRTWSVVILGYRPEEKWKIREGGHVRAEKREEGVVWGNLSSFPPILNSAPCSCPFKESDSIQ